MPPATKGGPSSDSDSDSDVVFVPAEQVRKPAAAKKAKAADKPTRGAGDVDVRVRKEAALVLAIDQEDGCWRLPVSPDEALYRFRVEKAPSGRAQCKACGTTIAKDAIRVGKPIKWKTYISSWSHLDCFWIGDAEPVDFDAGEVYGLDNLDASEVLLVRDALNKKERPSFIQVFDPSSKQAEPKQREVAAPLETPPCFTVKLLPFQQESLGWLLSREKQGKGGILADEMGMGKTIQMIAVMVSNKVKPTLILAPSSAMMQWADEIARCTGKELSVYVYQKATSRSVATPADLLAYDVVLSSYPIVESEYRKAIDDQKVRCEFCARKLLPRKLWIHLKYFCGPEAQKTARLAKTERSRQSATDKAMKTLRIGVPTPASIYSELMMEAGRPVAHMGMSKEEAIALDEGAKPQPAALSKYCLWFSPSFGAFWTQGDGLWRSSRADTTLALMQAHLDSVVLKAGTGLVRLIPGAVDLSDDGGVTWSNAAAGDWVGANATIAKGASLSHELVYNVVARRFGGKDHLGVVVYMLPQEKGEEDLFKVVHDDGDEEELETSEVRSGVRRASSKGLKLEWMSPSLAKSSDKVTSKKSKAKAPATNKKKKKKKGSDSDDDDSDYVEAAADEDNDEDDDEDDDDLPEVVMNTPEVPTALPRFVPQTWGRQNPPIFASRWASSKLKAKSPSKTPSRSSKRAAGDSDSDVEVVPKNKRAAGESSDDDEEDVKPKRKRRVMQEKKAAGDSDDEPAAEAEGNEWPDDDDAPKAKLRFAAEGDVIDEDGNDLGQSLLHCIAWRRIILDEAHKIKERTNSTAKSAFALHGPPVEEMAEVGAKSLSPVSAGAVSATDGGTDEAYDDDDGGGKSAQQQARKKRGKTAWYFYAQANRASTPGETLKEANKALSLAWKAATPEERKPYEAMAKADQKRVEALEEEEPRQLQSMIVHDSCLRWALTGTPLMNRIGDLYSLVRFLRVRPYAYYFCKHKGEDGGGCGCEMLQWSFGGDARYCQSCGHTPMSHYSYFNKQIVNPVTRNGYSGAGHKAMTELRDVLLADIMLRRTKGERGAELNLPSLTISVEKLALSPSEKDFYEAVYKRSQAQFDTFVDKGTVLNNYAHVFQLLSRLRQATDHPYLVLYGPVVARKSNEPITTVASRSAGQSDVCGLCQLEIDATNLALAKCRHTFHRDCLDAYMAREEERLEAEAGKGSKKSRGKKRKADEEDAFEVDREDGAATLPDGPAVKCPTCFVPLTISLRLKDGVENEGDEEPVCVVCMDRPREAVLDPCGHCHFCMECASALESRTCPVCRAKIARIVKDDRRRDKTKNPLFGRNSILQRIKLDSEFASSSKLDGVVQCISAALSEPEQAGLPNKCIVFSQFTNFLDLVQWRLESLKVAKVVKLVGSLNQEERRSVLSSFQTKKEVNVILMSLKAGGEGLNLQQASHVFSLDPWWNPSVEMQAIHRAHRIGQTRPVKAVRFVTVGTIEERMLELQDKKHLMFSGAFESNDASLEKLTVEDLRFLMGR